MFNEVQRNLIKDVIVVVLSVFSEKSHVLVDNIKRNGSPIEYTGDVGVFISILIEIHNIFELEFNLDLNLVTERFPTIESVIEYFIIRIANEKV